MSSYLLPPSPFSQWTPSPFTVDLVEYDCAEQFMMASNARLLGDNLALSAILATDDPREQKCLDRHIRHFDHDFWQQECEHLVLRGNLAKSSQNDEIRLALGHIDQRRLPEATPHGKLWGIDLSACDPESTNASTVNAPLWPRPLAKYCEHIVPRGNIATFSQKGKIRFLPLDILANAASLKLAPMINCGAPA